MRTWENNADDFSGLIRQDKDFRLAALVACSVERGLGGTVPSGTIKCTMRQFAERSNCSPQTIMRYLRNWEAMASEGLVRNPETLSPDDVDTLEPSIAAIERWEKMPTSIAPIKTIDREPIETLHALAQTTPFDFVRIGMVNINSALMKIEENITLVSDPDELAVFAHRIERILARIEELRINVRA